MTIDSPETAAFNTPTRPSARTNRTVTGTPASANTSSNVIKKSRTDLIKTIQEITKYDEFTINQAIEACQDADGRFSIETVLNILMDEKSNENNITTNNNNGSKSNNKQAYTASSPSSSEESSKYFSNKNNTSLGNTGTTATADYSMDDAAEHNDDEDYDLRRAGQPAGLKNLGNTCWFNSIIQTLFHLAPFRHLILAFRMEPADVKRLSSENERHLVQFVLELRRLFALMARSRRRVITPSQTLRMLRSCSKYDASTFNQEDVSEFATILVNLIEDSFNLLSDLQQKQIEVVEKGLDGLSVEEESLKASLTFSPSKMTTPANTRKNPIINLFNGKAVVLYIENSIEFL